MELFSKRYTIQDLRQNFLDDDDDVKKQNFLSVVLRNRLQEEVRYIVASNNFLEPFLVVDDQVLNSFYLHENSLRDLSRRELGYDMTEIVNPKTIDFNSAEYSDIYFFDLIELTIIFSKSSRRNDLVRRLERILKEEADIFVIHGFMIIQKGVLGLRSLLPLVKSQILALKLKEYFSTGLNYQARARSSADILQLIFSSPDQQKDTRIYTENICKEVATKWAEKENIERLAGLISATVLNSKSLSNEISNIRHTDQHTIPVGTPDLYKLISTNNIAVAEFVILSLPGRFIATQSPEEINGSYLKKYNLKSVSGWRIEKPTEVPFINESDLPF